jgi:HSP20 family protein
MTEKSEDEYRRYRKRYSPDIFRNLDMLSPFDMLRNLKHELDIVERGQGNYIWGSEHPHRPPQFHVSMDFPQMDIFDEGENLKIVIEIPGGSKEELELEMEEFRFNIHAKTKIEKCVEDAYVVRCSHREREFGREIRLPTAVIPDEAKASFKNEVLEIIVPKKKEERKRAKISIE